MHTRESAVWQQHALLEKDSLHGRDWLNRAHFRPSLDRCSKRWLATAIIHVSTCQRTCGTTYTLQCRQTYRVGFGDADSVADFDPTVAEQVCDVLYLLLQLTTGEGWASASTYDSWCIAIALQHICKGLYPCMRHDLSGQMLGVGVCAFGTDCGPAVLFVLQ